jgi:hypothetical protein
VKYWEIIADKIAALVGRRTTALSPPQVDCITSSRRTAAMDESCIAESDELLTAFLKLEAISL